MSERWFVAKQKQKLGPFTADQLRDMATAQVILPADMVLKEGTTKWAPASDLQWLFPIQAAVSEVPLATIAPPEQPSIAQGDAQMSAAPGDPFATGTWTAGASPFMGSRFRILRSHAKG